MAKRKQKKKIIDPPMKSLSDGMIDDLSNLKIISGNTHPKFGAELVKCLGLGRLSSTAVRNFSNGETDAIIMESIREMDVFIIQPTCTDPNNSLIELLTLIDAARRASARRITAVIPCFGYARQDKKEKSRTPVSAKLIANMFEVAGVNRILTMDLHSTQIQGFFNIPVDNLYAEPFLVKYIEENIPGEKVIVSPGVSSAKLAKRIADNLLVSLSIIHFGQIEPGKTKDEVLESAEMRIVGEIHNKIAILVDDLADNCLMLVEMAKALKDSGAVKVFVVASHGIFSGNSVELVNNSVIEKFIITNTNDVTSLHSCVKLEVINVTSLFADAIKRIHLGQSYSFSPHYHLDLLSFVPTQ